MKKEVLLYELAKVEKLATTSKLGRLVTRPIQYIYALSLRDLFKRSASPATCETFFGSKMHIVLPSASDIYITKGKSHDSEIRLARFLINQLDESDTFLDIGAHYGYFSLLASKLVGERGKVHCFEAAPSTFKVLSKNIALARNITAVNQAASNKKEQLTFYEFPPIYSEYNSMDIAQYKGQDWFAQHPPKTVNIPAISLDDYFQASSLQPKIIKIDVEGAERIVLEGAQQYLKNNSPIIAMEYIASEDINSTHQQASQFLKHLGYQSYAINTKGELISIKDVENYMKSEGLDSDNVVFNK